MRTSVILDGTVTKLKHAPSTEMLLESDGMPLVGDRELQGRPADSCFSDKARYHSVFFSHHCMVIVVLHSCKYAASISQHKHHDSFIVVVIPMVNIVSIMNPKPQTLSPKPQKGEN